MDTIDCGKRKLVGYFLHEGGMLSPLGEIHFPAPRREDAHRPAPFPESGGKWTDPVISILPQVLPEGWNASFGALLEGRIWITGPRDASLWVNSAPQLALLARTTQEEQVSITFCDFFNNDRMAEEGQRPGTPSKFLASMFGIFGDALLAEHFLERCYVMGYNLALDVLGPSYEGKRFAYLEKYEPVLPMDEIAALPQN